MAKRAGKRSGKPQPEQNVLYFEMTAATNHIDLASCLTAINRKQYHQTKNLKPLAYHFRVQGLDVDSSIIKFSTAPNTWTTKNAVVKAGAEFRKYLGKNGLKRSQLPIWGRELRFALTTVETGYTHATGSDGFGRPTGAGLQPMNFLSDQSTDNLGEAFADYTDTASGDGVSTVTFELASGPTLLSLSESGASGEPEAIVMALTGTSNHGDNKLAVIPEYLSGRRNQDDVVSVDHEIPSDDNLLNRLGSSTEEHYDEVIQAMELSHGTHRPYNEAGANALYPQCIVAAVGDYASGVSPCGLLEVKGTANQEFLLWVTAITEM